MRPRGRGGLPGFRWPSAPAAIFRGALLLSLVLLVACGSGASNHKVAGRTPTPLPTPTPTSQISTPSATPTAAVPALPPTTGSLTVPILMYHYIRDYQVPSDPTGEGLSVSPANFTKQMDWLTQNGYHTVTIEQISDYLNGTGTLPTKPVALTFDDGLADFYTAAYPILKAHGFVATSYVITGFIGDANGHSMTGPQITEVSNYGIEIGAHTFNHPDLTKIPASQYQLQLADPRQTLQQLTGKPTLDFAYPSGQYNATVAAAVQAAGYQTAVTTNAGLTHTLGDRYTWTRQRVDGSTTLPAFAALLS